MKVLMTGASGFLGGHVLGLLRQHGIAVWTLGRRCPAGQDAAAHVGCDLLAEGDLGEALCRLAPSHLLHLAWVTDPASYQTSALNDDWARATVRLAQHFLDSGGRHLVVAGSCAEYDWSHGWCHEHSTPLLPATPYGRAKDATRQHLLALCAQHGARLAWGRIFFPFGTGQAPERLIPSLVSALTGTREPFPVQAGQMRDFVCAADVASALLTLLTSPAQDCFNISSAQPIAVGDLVRLLAQRIGADPQPLLAMAARRLQAPELVAGDNGRLRALGWAGPTALGDGLAPMVMLALRAKATCEQGSGHGVR